MASLREQLSAWAEENAHELIFYDPPAIFDQAILGLVYGSEQELVVCYDEQRVLAGLIADGMEEDEAQDWFQFNTVGSYLGPLTPRFLIRPTEVIDESTP